MRAVMVMVGEQRKGGSGSWEEAPMVRGKRDDLYMDLLMVCQRRKAELFEIFSPSPSTPTYKYIHRPCSLFRRAFII